MVNENNYIGATLTLAAVHAVAAALHLAGMRLGLLAHAVLCCQRDFP